MVELHNRNIGRNLIWYSAGYTVYMFSLWLITIVVVRLSGYEDAGVLSLAMSSTSVFYAISMWGMRSFQVSDITEEYSDNTYITSRLITSSLALIICIIFILISGYDRNTRICILLYIVETIFFLKILSYHATQDYIRFYKSTYGKLH